MWKFYNPYYPPFPKRVRLKQLRIFELPTTNVALSETSVDFGIDRCVYNELPCECYLSMLFSQAVPDGGAALPVTVVVPTSTTSTNTGTTTGNGEAVCVIGIASSAAEYMNSIVHEVLHLCKFIGRAEGLDPYGEEVCYIGGEIAQKMWPKTKLLTSECGCYTKRIDKVL